VTDPLNPRGICRIAVVRSYHRLGNNLLLMPLLDVLEQAFPGAEIDVVTVGHAPALPDAREGRPRPRISRQTCATEAAAGRG